LAFSSKKINAIFIFLIILVFSLSLFLRTTNYKNEPLGKFFLNKKFGVITDAEVMVHPIYVFLLYDNVKPSKHKYLAYHGNGIYPSFPAPMFIIPYSIAKILHVNPLNYLRFLQNFSIFIHFLCCILIYYLIIEFINEKGWKSGLVAFLTTIIYIFNTNSLNSHMNVYWAHQLTQPIYFLLLYLFVKYKSSIGYKSLGGLTFLYPYITWTGYTFNVGLFLYYFVLSMKNRFDKKWLIRMGIVVSASVLAFTVNMLHFMTRISAHDYIYALCVRAGYRSILHYGGLDFWCFFANSLIIDYGVYFILCIILCFILYKTNKSYFTDKKFSFSVIALTCFPLLESVVLLQHDFVYNFGRLKFAVPLMLVFALISYGLIKQGTKWVVFLITGVIIASSVHFYLYSQIYNPKNFPLYKGDCIKCMLQQCGVEKKCQFSLDKINNIRKIRDKIR